VGTTLPLRTDSPTLGRYVVSEWTSQTLGRPRAAPHAARFRRATAGGHCAAGTDPTMRRMHRGSTIGFAIVLASCAAGAVTGEEGASPIARTWEEYSLEVDGVAHDVRLDQRVAVEIGGRTTTVRLVPKPTRRFELPQLSFEFMRNRVFHEDLGNPNIPKWTIDGDDTSLMLIRTGPVAPQEVLDQMVEGLRSKIELESAESTLLLAGTGLTGVKLRYGLADQVIEQEFYAFSAGGSGFLLMLQDVPGDSGEPSAEAVEARRLLTGSFAFAK
jgi:hypothetical protein